MFQKLFRKGSNNRMKCIVGLGNPGKKYENTRHNVGFMVIDELAKRHGFSLTKNKFKGHYAMEFVEGEKVILLKPQTFMNLSGESIRPLMEYYDIPLKDLIVIYDDMDLPTGKIRLRQKGGHGGHNGVRNTIDQLGTKEFQRIRVGIGRPVTRMSVIDYVLGSFPKEEQDDLMQSIAKAADACESFISGKTFMETMNEYNK